MYRLGKVRNKLSESREELKALERENVRNDLPERTGTIPEKTEEVRAKVRKRVKEPA